MEGRGSEEGGRGEVRQKVSDHLREEASTPSLTARLSRVKMRSLFPLLLFWAPALVVDGSVGGVEGGIRVPGQGFSALDVFRLMADSCQPASAQDYSAKDIISNSLNMLRGETGERISGRMLESLVGGVGETDLRGLMGRWMGVFQSASLGNGCLRSHWRLLSAAPYAGTFSITSYHTDPQGKPALSHGYGLQLGPGPALTLVAPHDEPCPFVIVRAGPRDAQGQYEYLILAQFLKTPLIGLARDPMRFHRKHKAEVQSWLRTAGFLNPFSPSNAAITFVDYSTCPYDPFAPFG